MGYYTELNTLLRLPHDFATDKLKEGRVLEVVKEKERVFPLHIAMLLVADNWTFLGYCVVDDVHIHDGKTVLAFEVLSLFTKEEQKLYTEKFLEATKKTGEL